MDVFTYFGTLENATTVFSCLVVMVIQSFYSRFLCHHVYAAVYFF